MCWFFICPAQIHADGLQLLDTSFIALLSAFTSPTWKQVLGCQGRLDREICSRLAMVVSCQALQWHSLAGQEGFSPCLSASALSGASLLGFLGPLSTGGDDCHHKLRHRCLCSCIILATMHAAASGHCGYLWLDSCYVWLAVALVDGRGLCKC